MDFQARTYDQRVGGFMNVDPLAAFGGQDMFPLYVAMGNTPGSNIDSNGLSPFGSSQRELSLRPHSSMDDN